MRDYYDLKGILFTMLAIVLLAGSITAQPSAGKLADDILEKNSERLSQIETISFTIQPLDGGIIPEITSNYEKRVENNVAYLAPVDDETDVEYGGLTGSFDDKLAELVRGASSIATEQLEGYGVYRIFVDDKELIRSLEGTDPGFDELDSESETETLTFWIDTKELYVRKVHFDQTIENGGEMSVEIRMEDYRIYSGFPVAHTLIMTVHGMENQFSEEDLAEARMAMNQMEEQLSQMPEAQRKAVERQIKPQMEQFEQMLSEEGPGQMVIEVVDVRVNE